MKTAAAERNASSLDRQTLKLQLIDMFFDRTRVTRLKLALVSLGWALILMLPGEVLTRPAYLTMREMFPQPVWATLFLLYSLAALWRLFYSRSTLLGYIVNLYGLALFTAGFISFVAAGLKPIPPSTAMWVGLVLVAFWCFVRTPTENE